MKKLTNGLLWTLGVLVAIALLLRALLFDVWKIPEDPILAASVAPTLAGGDVVVLLTVGTPGFGELVRCADPDTPGSYVVGRIAGVGGDVVVTEGSTLIRNDTHYNPESACPKPKLTITHPTTGQDVEIRCDVVAMGGDRHFRGTSPKGALERKVRTDVRTNTVFLLSDNRNLHDDSRDFGVQPVELCEDRIFFRLWSKDGWGDDENRLTYIR